MIKLIPSEIITVYKKFQDAGFEVYLVGGCVRNLFLQKEVKDWDLTTNATPEQILKLFPDGFYDNKFGTVGIPIAIPVILGTQSGAWRTPESEKERDSGQSLASARRRHSLWRRTTEASAKESQNDEKQIVEATTFRTEHGYSDRRRPDVVKWGKTIEEDLARRDFTVNAIALKLITHNSKLITNIIDPFNGQEDIKDKIIRAVGDPKQRFKEDALRLIRAIRIATEHGFTIENKTWEEIISDAHLISEVSGERVRIELLRILASKHPYDGTMLLKNSSLLQYILPELLEGINVSQARPGRHHTTDVFTHNILSLKFCPSADPIVRFATLLHDVGKPRVEKKDEKGLVIFHNHEIVGARMARIICDRLRFSKKDRDKIVNLIRWHMFTVDEKITDAAVRRFIRRVGVESVKDMMDLRIGDRLGGGTQTAESWRLKLFKKRIEDQLKPAPFSINDLAIDGNDIMKELSIKPGPKIGEILQKLFEEVDEDLSKNNKEYLLKRIKEVV